MQHGVLHVLAVFDKPDPLDGRSSRANLCDAVWCAAFGRAAIVDAVAQASKAIGWRTAVHAECRVNDGGVFVLEVAARPIGGLCARALQFRQADGNAASTCSLEELLLRHAIGEAVESWTRESRASAVMMIPIPRRGLFRRAERLEEARSTPGVDDIRVTAKPDQLLVPLPEGASYLGFIFAHGREPADAEAALRAAHAQIRFVIVPEIPVLARA